MKSYEDCVRAAQTLGFKAVLIAEAHGITIPHLDLAAATTQEKRWEVCRNAPADSDVEKAAFAAILEHATSQDERWKVYHNAPEGSDVQKVALRALCANV